MVAQPVGTVTLLFSDVEGSTRLLERLGAARYRESLELHRRLLREAFERHGGYEVDYEGDSFFVAFCDAAEAVAAAAESQEALAAAKWPEEMPVLVRMGIHTGEPLPAPPKYVGLDVHKAARIMAAGHGGQVLISATTCEAVGDAGLVSLGEHRLKDLLQPEPLYQLRIRGLPGEFPALKTLGNRPTNLPIQPDALIGRERELAELTALLSGEQVRLVTLTGPGGTGKTRLALQAAAELADSFVSGVFFVSLAPVRDPDMVVPTIAEALNVRERAGEPLADTLAIYLEQKQMLLVLDNFEQVVGAAAEVAVLIDRCRQLAVMVTTRERLRLRGEHVYPVPPMALVDPAAVTDALVTNEAVALFAARAAAATGQSLLDADTAPVVAGICARLDGLPLAIELAAARTAVLAPEALLGRLDERLPILTGGPREVEERQRTLRATIDWSYELLSHDEQQLFQRLSVFTDGCRLDAARAVAAQDLQGELLDGLQALVEKSLLRRREDADGEPRFWMLETIREYGLERLRERGDLDEVAQCHAEHFLAIAAARGSRPEGQDAVMMRIFSADHANLRAALDWFHSSGEGDAELRLVTALSEFWNLGGHYREAWKSIRTALETSTPLATQVRALALAEASDWARFAGRVDLAREYCNESLAISRQIGDERGIRRALHELGEAAAEEEAYAEAAALYEQAIAAARAVGEDAPGSIANLGWVTLQQGDARQARALFEQSLPFWRDHGNAEGTMVLLEFLAEANLALGETEQTRDHLLEGLELASAAEAAGDTAVEMLETAAELLLQSGAPEEAARIAGASDALLEAGGFRPVSADRRRRERLRADLSTSLGPALDTLLAEGRETAGHAKDLAAQAIAALPLE